jgi:tetratricopeptide (TPR) repeat protein
VLGDNVRAKELALQALALAEKFGGPEVMSLALNTLGIARVDLGDPGGIEDLERSVEIAASAGALSELSRALNNLSTQLGILGDLKRGYEVRLEGAKVADRIGSEVEIQWYRAVLSEYPYRRGEWAESLRLIDEFLGLLDAGEPHYATWQTLARRAEIRMARGAEADALADADRALELVVAIPDPQARYFTNALCAHVFVASRRERATELTREVIDDLRHGIGPSFATFALPALASAALRLDLLPELDAALESHLATPWTDAVHRYAAGDFVGAAEVLASVGSKPEEAEARVHAARQLAAEGRDDEAHAQLEQAIAFFRSVGASRYLESAEAIAEERKRVL